MQLLLSVTPRELKVLDCLANREPPDLLWSSDTDYFNFKKKPQVNPVREHRAVSWLKSRTTYSDRLLKPTFFVIVSLAFTSSCPGFEVESSVSWKALSPRMISNPNWADSVTPAKLLNCYLLTPIYPFHMYAFFNFFCFLNFFYRKPPEGSNRAHLQGNIQIHSIFLVLTF